MTIAISLKVNDGVVLAADSASTLLQQTANGPSVVLVYNNANKVFNLRKGLPIGMITWGSGSIGRASISTLVKDLRVRLTHPGSSHKDWHIDPEDYSIEDVANKVKGFIYEEHYQHEFQEWPQKPTLGFIVAGYSTGSGLAEEYRIDINDKGVCDGPSLVRPKDQCGATWSGEPEAINRLILGHSPLLAQVLEKQLDISPDRIPQAMQVITQLLAAPVIFDAMPIQDAIDLAEFLVDVTERFSRYTPGAATVGGPIETAAITKHEGFKWVKRKYYYSVAFNPESMKPEEE